MEFGLETLEFRADSWEPSSINGGWRREHRLIGNIEDSGRIPSFIASWDIHITSNPTKHLDT